MPEPYRIPDPLTPRPFTGVNPQTLAGATPQPLSPARPLAQPWWSTAPVTHGERHDARASLVWSCDGDWLHAGITVDESAHADGLQGAARHAYATLFALMDEQGLTQPARFWNYLADINAVTDSPAGRLERYRQFNIGRQQAFMAAGQAAFDGAPAACALGTEGGALSVWLLAGRVAPHPIENPRQVSAYRYPNEHGPVSPTFSRAAVLQLSQQRSLLFISGTASIVGHASVHPGDVAEQTRESLRNIDVLLAQVEADAARLRPRLDLTLYLRHAQDLAVVQPIVAHWLDHDAAAMARAIWLRADVCRAELLVEIEAQAELAAPSFPQHR
jgi:enamine deaminase RidA (YjgF/YER057c/UK114 family)